VDIKNRVCLGILWKLEKFFKKPYHPFNKEGDMWENLYLWEYKTTAKTLQHFHIDFSGKTVLDVGCAVGGKSAYIGEYAEKVIGIDINRTSIANGKLLIEKHHPHLTGKVELRVDNAYNLSLADNSVDIVFIDDVWEHISKPSNALKEALRVLKPGGYILIAFPPLNHPWAAHVNDLIPIPWIHYCVSEKYIVRWYIRKALKTRGGIDRLKFKNMKPSDAKIEYINHMTLERTLAIFSKYRDQMDIIDFSYDLLKVPFSKVLSKMERFGLFFFSKYYFTLKKRG